MGRAREWEWEGETTTSETTTTTTTPKHAARRDETRARQDDTTKQHSDYLTLPCFLLALLAAAVQYFNHGSYFIIITIVLIVGLSSLQASAPPTGLLCGRGR